MSIACEIEVRQHLELKKKAQAIRIGGRHADFVPRILRAERLLPSRPMLSEIAQAKITVVTFWATDYGFGDVACVEGFAATLRDLGDSSSQIPLNEQISHLGY